MTDLDRALVLTAALRDLLAMHDKITGEKSDGAGWTAADVTRMAEIREIVILYDPARACYPIPGDKKPAGGPILRE